MTDTTWSRAGVHEQYIGEFKYNKFDGKGTLFTPKGKYIGEFRGGRKHGTGSMVWHNGRKYEGEWKDGFMDGVRAWII